MSFLRRILGFGAERREAVGQPPAPPPAPHAVPVLAVGDPAAAKVGAAVAPPLTADARHSGVPPAAVQIVGEFEGFREAAYLCPAKVWTIGFGTTRWADGSPVTKGDGPITEDAARRLLARDLAAASEAVDDLVTVALTEHQRAALISLVYNIGRGAFSRSTLLTHINAGRYDSAAGEFMRWVHGGGKVLPGLVRRRAAEATLFAGRA